MSKGVITDAVPVPGGSEPINYAIYLPENYTADKKWPVIFVFDIEGKGKKGLEAFTASPGGKNFILIGANNVRNVSYEENFYIAKRLFEVVLKTFPIDSKRIYTSGYGGGGRLATAIAAISGDVDGVIACGAALPGNKKYEPKKNDFLFVGLVGDEDGNYREMQSTISILYGKKFEADLAVYDGSSYYPPADYMDKAIRTLMIKAIAKGAVPEGEKMVDSLFKADLDFNRKMERIGQALYAFEDVDQLMSNYSKYVEKGIFRERKKEIRKNRQFGKQRSDNYGVSEEESYFMTDYLTFLSDDLSNGNVGQLPSWEEEMLSLEKIEKGDNRARTKMAKRLKNMLKAVMEETIPTLDSTHTDRLLFANAFMVLLDPGREDAYLEVLRYSVKKSEYGMALFYLEQLLNQGFKDVNKLNSIEGIALLRILPEYNDILEEHGLKTLY
ncbi:acetylxylan esterase [Sinomicrobium sp. M5D2P9]